MEKLYIMVLGGVNRMSSIDYDHIEEKYNLFLPERKIEYVKNSEYGEKTKLTLFWMFNLTNQFERRFMTDVSHFNEEQYLAFLNAIPSYETINSYSSYLKKYNKNINPTNRISIINLARDNGLLDMTHDMKISENAFPSRFDFYGAINEYLANYRDRLVLALIYEGIKAKELLDLK